MNCRPALQRMTLAGLGAIAISAAASGHAQLTSPNGGEQLEVGSTFLIEWFVLIPHDLEAWDLAYSTEGPDGPWIDIAVGLDGGDGEPGAEHSYEWTVPDVVDRTVWVRVIMDNSDVDYPDSSDAPFSIVPAPCAGDIDGSGAVDVTDLLDLLAAWGSCNGCGADLTGDGVVDVSDLLDLLANWGTCA